MIENRVETNGDAPWAEMGGCEAVVHMVAAEEGTRGWRDKKTVNYLNNGRVIMRALS